MSTLFVLGFRMSTVGADIVLNLLLLNSDPTDISDDEDDDVLGIIV